MSQEKLVSHFEKRETKLRTYQTESFDKRMKLEERKVAKLKRQMENVLPSTIGWNDYNLFYLRTQHINADRFGVAKREGLDFTHYCMSKQIFELPKEHQILNWRCIIVAYFNKEQVLLNYGVLGSRFGDVATFHTNSRDMCLGNQQESVKEGVTLDNPSSIVKSFNTIKEILTIVNPYSYLNSHQSDLPDKMGKTMTYLRDLFRERGVTNDDDSCGDCGEHLDDCSCNNCNDCGYHMDECECNRCDDCMERRHSDNYDICECEPRVVGVN